MGTTNQSEVVRALVGLADNLVADYDTSDLLQRTVDDCTRLLDVPAAGLLLAGQDGALRVAASSSEQVRLLEILQVQGDEGPCLEAYSRSERVAAAGRDELQRWGGFAAVAQEAGFCSVAAVPLRLRERTLGALGLFSDRDEAPAAGDVDVAQAFADIATIAILQQQAVLDSRSVTEQLQRALDSRVVIEQAKGVVAAQLGIDVAAAFALLRDHARTRSLPLQQLADDVTAGRIDGSGLHRKPSQRAARRVR